MLFIKRAIGELLVMEINRFYVPVIKSNACAYSFSRLD